MKLAFRVLGLCLAALIGAGTLVPSARAAGPEGRIILAQAEGDRRPGIFRFLFRNRRQEQRRVIIVPAPQVQPPRQVRPKQAQPRRTERRKNAKSRRQQRETARQSDEKPSARPRKERRKRRAVAAAPAPKIEPVEKAPDAKRVLLVGDFMAETMAKGLTDAYDQNANIVVVAAPSGDSGLVRADYYDWSVKLPELVAEHKPDAIVLSIGANDRQTINTDAGPQRLESEGWRAAYSARVSALAEALKATGKPALWAGLPPVRAAATSRHYSTINGIVREQIETKGVPFVDTWEGFVDEEGKFVAVGPDVGGQSVQLRTSDGLNFTKAGRRKLAFFLEQPLSDLLGGSVPAVAALDPAAAGVLPPGPGGPAEQIPEISPMVPIDALATGDALSAAPIPAAAAAPAAEPTPEPAVVATISKRLSGDGEASAPAGRADNFAWPAPRLQLPPPPAAPPPGAPAVASAPIMIPPAAPPGPGPAPPSPGAALAPPPAPAAGVPPGPETASSSAATPAAAQP